MKTVLAYVKPLLAVVSYAPFRDGVANGRVADSVNDFICASVAVPGVKIKTDGGIFLYDGFRNNASIVVVRVDAEISLGREGDKPNGFEDEKEYSENKAQSSRDHEEDEDF